MRNTIRIIIVLAAAALATAVASAARAESGPPQFAPVQKDAAILHALEAKAAGKGTVPVIVTLADAPSAPLDIRRHRNGLLSALGSPQLRGLKTSDDMPFVAFRATADQIKRLQASKDVAAVTEDREVTADFGHQDASPGPVAPPSLLAGLKPASGTAAGISSNGSASQLTSWWDYYRIGVDTARANGANGAGQTVALIDTGVDRTHPWLAGKVVAEACFATTTSGSGACPNGSTQQYGVGAAAPCRFSYDCAHGTHTAHTAAGLYGVASGANIAAVQIFHCCGSSGRPTYFESDLVWALSYVYSLRSTYQIPAVNMSIGGGLFSGYCDNASVDGSVGATYVTGWLNALRNVGIAPVVATGNGDSSTQMGSPGCIKSAVSVGNTTLDANNNDAVFAGVSGGSNSNATLDLLAPGTDICSAVPVSLDADGNADGIGCSWIGTSMAAPHVAGAMAVLRQRKPLASVDQLQYALASGGTTVFDSRNGVSRSRINVWGALARV
jgi:subtilisin family serine protease